MSSESPRYQDVVPTHETDTVHIPIVEDEFTNSPVIRPVRNQATLIWASCNTNKGMDVWMLKVPPNDSRFAKPLGRRSEKVSGKVKHNDGTDPAPQER